MNSDIVDESPFAGSVGQFQSSTEITVGRLRSLFRAASSELAE
jgi:hypothetical protein